MQWVLDALAASHRSISLARPGILRRALGTRRAVHANAAGEDASGRLAARRFQSAEGFDGESYNFV